MALKVNPSSRFLAEEFSFHLESFTGEEVALFEGQDLLGYRAQTLGLAIIDLVLVLTAKLEPVQDRIETYYTCGIKFAFNHYSFLPGLVSRFDLHLEYALGEGSDEL